MSDSDARRRSTDRRSGRERRFPSDRRAGQADAAGGRAAEARGVERRSGRDRRDETGWEAVRLESGPRADPSEDDLVAAAAAARLLAHAHFSGFKVGAALETSDGTIVTGCNIENASYGLTLCAERVALVKALSEGHTAFTRIVVVADQGSPVPPCGPCRQLLWEYCGDVEVILANLDSVTARHPLLALLPLPFDRRLLE